MSFIRKIIDGWCEENPADICPDKLIKMIDNVKYWLSILCEIQEKLIRKVNIHKFAYHRWFISGNTTFYDKKKHTFFGHRIRFIMEFGIYRS